MSKRTPSDDLDEAIEAIMTNPDRPAPATDPRLAELLRIAGDLRDLPSRAFRDRLKDELAAAARRGAAPVPPAYGKVLMTVEDYLDRLEELKTAPPLVPYDLRTALSQVPDRGTRFLTTLNRCTLGVSWFSGSSHWELHAGGDELLHILDGEAEVVTMTHSGPVRTLLGSGSIFICPQGLWHRVRPRSEQVSMFFATPEGTQAHRGDAPPAPAPTAGADSSLRAHDLGAVMSDLPLLTIDDTTTEAEADAATRSVARLGPCTLGMMRYAGLTPWERHPDGDELLHVLEGAVDITVLTDDGPRQVSVEAGSVFVCPQGLWHRQLPRPAVTMLYGTPVEHGEVSFADDPRVG